MALAGDEISVGKNHARNGEWIDITMKKINILLSMDEDSDWQTYLKYINIDLKDDILALKQAKLEAVTFQIQNTELTKLNHALQVQLKEERNVNEKWLNSLKKVSQCNSEQIPNQRKKILGGDQLTETSSLNKVERLNPESKLLNFNTRRILVPKSQAVNECLQLTEERSGLGTMKHTKPETQESSNKSVSGPVIIFDTEPVTSSVPTKVKTNDQESKIDELTKLVQMLMDEKINSTQKIQEPKYVSLQPESSKSVNSSKQSQDSKPNGKNHDSSKLVRTKPLQKPKLKCELFNYTNHSINDWYRILYCMKCKKEDHRTLNHDMYIASLRSSQNYKAQPYQYASPSKQILKSKAKSYPPCTHYVCNNHHPHDCRNYPECEISRSYDHFTLGHNHVIQIRGGVKSYLHKYVKKPGPKVVFVDNSSCITEGYGSINCGGIIFSKVAFVNGLKYNLISISQLCDAKYICQYDDKQGTIFNANKEIVLIAPRRNDVYVLDMSSLTPNGAYFFAKALESVNWLWHKRLSHFNFKNINKISKQKKFLAFLHLFILRINHVLHVKKENIKELLSKLNKTSQSGNACIFSIWTSLDLSVEVLYPVREMIKLRLCDCEALLSGTKSLELVGFVFLSFVYDYVVVTGDEVMTAWATA
ncbi:retrovirus-related pol polyprotein from transposon TNT 1-94 [Tanacetum coccineum]